MLGHTGEQGLIAKGQWHQIKQVCVQNKLLDSAGMPMMPTHPSGLESAGSDVSRLTGVVS